MRRWLATAIRDSVAIFPVIWAFFAWSGMVFAAIKMLRVMAGDPKVSVLDAIDNVFYSALIFALLAQKPPTPSEKHGG
jgi:hypothetical protein